MYMYVCISIYTHYTYIAYYTYDVYYTVSIKGGLSIHSFPMIFFPSQQKLMVSSPSRTISQGLTNDWIVTLW